MNAAELAENYAVYSNRMTEAACDPGTPKADFSWHCRTGQLAAMVAFLMDAVRTHAPEQAEVIAQQVHELASDGEPLADWVSERLADENWPEQAETAVVQP